MEMTAAAKGWGLRSELRFPGKNVCEIGVGGRRALCPHGPPLQPLSVSLFMKMSVFGTGGSGPSSGQETKDYKPSGQPLS